MHEQPDDAVDAGSARIIPPVNVRRLAGLNGIPAQERRKSQGSKTSTGSLKELPARLFAIPSLIEHKEPPGGRMREARRTLILAYPRVRCKSRFGLEHPRAVSVPTNCRKRPRNGEHNPRNRSKFASAQAARYIVRGFFPVQHEESRGIFPILKRQPNEDVVWPPADGGHLGGAARILLRGYWNAAKLGKFGPLAVGPQRMFCDGRSRWLRRVASARVRSPRPFYPA